MRVSTARRAQGPIAFEMELEEKLALGQKKKDVGNAHFKVQRHLFASLGLLFHEL